MSLKISKITKDQALKIAKALYYSFTSGFVGGFTLAVSSALSNLSNGGSLNLSKSVVIGLIIAGVVGGVNTLLVTVKQLFTQAEGTVPAQ